MLAGLWLKGLLTRRLGRLLGAAAGMALTVALLGLLWVYTTASVATMTRRAVADVPVDWQVQLAPGADAAAIESTVSHVAAGTAAQPVGYADVAGFNATSAGTVQTTGAGKVLGLGPQYRQLFSAEVRPLTGSASGVLLAQQTAANLHAAAGDTVTIERIGLPPTSVRIDGVVDLPQADSLFQAIGVPAGSAPQAPPDNVLLLPLEQWHQMFDPQVAAHPGSVRLQLHVRLAHNLPSDPGAAYTSVTRLANKVEAQLSGTTVIGNNLAARLLGARADALYARVLFLFLGVPGALLAMLLTLAVAAAGAERRRREQALLRVRGAATGRVLQLALIEAVAVGGCGAVLGLALGAIGARGIPSSSSFLSRAALPGTVAALLAGLALAMAAILTPAWLQARRSTVAAARAVVGRAGQPLWQRLYVDAAFLVIAAIAFWQTASTGYQVVLAPEGVPQSSVAYQAFIAPVCFWIGAGLLAMRLWDIILGRGRRGLAVSLRPLARGLHRVVAASLARQRRRLVGELALVALAFAFAVSAAVFNTTYTRQSRVDAQLTNGADVTVTGSTTSPPGSMVNELRAIPGVAAIQLMQHRFAYVGNDLQDLYGIDPAHIGTATNVSNAFFASGNAQATLAALAGRPDGVLVSAETANNYQLRPGDQVRLRLQNAQDHQYHVVPFHFVGIVREFPTAPKDSFLVANASYIGQQTGSPAAETVLIRAAGNPATLAARVRDVVRPLTGARVSDIGTVQQAISSSLTSVDLRGLTALELTFAVLLVAGATGLIMALGLAERRRTFAILAALGAKGPQLDAFLWSEALVILGGGVVIGVLTGFALAEMLVKLLTGVFDPPPQFLAIPWPYLAVLAAAALFSTVTVVLVARTAARRPSVESLREGSG